MAKKKVKIKRRQSILTVYVFKLDEEKGGGRNSRSRIRK